jgi:tetratricopeptide (TPR) repeat protein
MIGFAWLALRQAQEALYKGRLEDAQRLLGQSCVHGHKRVWDLLQQVARGFVERGERNLKHDNPEAAWQDLLQAEQLKIANCGAERLRQALTQLGVAEVKGLLQAGQPERAAETVAQLRQRLVRQKELDGLEETARHWLEARELANRGQFAESQFLAERAARLLPGSALDRFRDELSEKQRNFGPLLLELHEAAEKGKWREVVALSERVLALAPQHGEARKLRSRAWKAIEPVTVAARPVSLQSTHDQPAEVIPQRFLLWIDGVGGYLVCMGARVTIGQATSESFVDIPLFADVSRLHATLTRDNEGYLLEAVRPVQVNGEPVDKALLRPNDRVTVGSSCQMRFRQPAPVSTSARLDVVSGHRLPLTVDAVLLMADTLVLGPGAHVHVELPEAKQNVVLYRHKDSLGVRYPSEFTINGQRVSERGLLGAHATVTGDEFALAIESIGTRMGRT